VWLWSAPDVFHLPLFLALWSMLLFAANSLWENKFAGTELWLALRQVGKVWSNGSSLLALAVLAFASHVPVYERLVTLGILTGVATGLGWQGQHRRWLDIGLGLFIILLHTWWFVWVPRTQIAVLLPWYACQTAVLV
jgi:hypothetical protein